jgi:cysteine synthase A
MSGTPWRGRGRGELYDSVCDAIGNTPCVKINDRMCPEGRTIYAKLEYFNPLSSVKDRLALSIIEQAEADGRLKPGDTVIEATSGNTGIAVAMVCAQRGYRCVICMAEVFSIERRKLMRMLGAKVIITPKSGKGTGMVKKAAELAEKHGWFLCRQFETDANASMHYAATGPEILNDFKDQRLDYFCLGYGTGGTFSGAGRAIKEQRPDIKIVLAEPEAAQMVASGTPTERLADGSAVGSHPAFTAHPIQGWAPDFIPLQLEKGLGMQEEMCPIPGPAAIACAQELARTQGILTGISGGASMFCAIETAKKAPEGSVIVAIIADTGERYLSTPLFASIEADMNAEELEISQSTPNFQLS